MDTDPRLIEIDRELSKIRQLIQEQQQTTKNANLIKKLIEWRKLKQLQQQYHSKKEFRQLVKRNIEKSKSRKRNRQFNKSYL